MTKLSELLIKSNCKGDLIQCLVYNKFLCEFIIQKPEFLAFRFSVYRHRCIIKSG